MEGKKKPLFIILLILFLLFLLLLILYFFGFFDEFLNGTPSQQSDETPSDTSQDVTYSEFSGDFFTASVPEGWTVVEYKDGAGSTMMVEGPIYLGLTGLEIKNPFGSVIFSLQSIYGFGGISGCDSYFRFDDDSTAYYNGILSDNEETDRGAPAVVDLQGLPYSSLDFFETRFRRIGTNLYWDTVSGETFFEAGCGMQVNIINFSAPQFTVDGVESSSSTYLFIVLSNASTPDLDTLDTILNSLEAL